MFPSYQSAAGPGWAGLSESGRVHARCCGALCCSYVYAVPSHTHNLTQVTVNNQIVIGTLMNICDNPNVVSVGQDWGSVSRIRRTPIIVTGGQARLHVQLCISVEVGCTCGDSMWARTGAAYRESAASPSS